MIGLIEELKNEIRAIDQTVCMSDKDYESRIGEIAEGCIQVLVRRLTRVLEGEE